MTTIQLDNAPALNEYDKDEWFDIARAARPGLTQEEYDGMWQRFIAMKAKRKFN